MLSKLNKASAASALTRAIETSAFNRDVDVLEDMILKAQLEGVDALHIQTASLILSELREEKEKRRKAVALLEAAMVSRNTTSIHDALGYLTIMGGSTTCPEVDRAHKVILEIKREVATKALVSALSAPTSISPEGFDEDKFNQLLKAVEETDSCMPAESEILVKAKARLEDQKVTNTFV